MAEDNRKMAESVRSGRYFEEARGWFQAVYIGPISERSFFLIVALAAALVALFAVIAVLSMMPLAPKQAVVFFATGDQELVTKTAIRLRRTPGEDVNLAIRRGFVMQYVLSREGYSATTVQRNAQQMFAHSTPELYASYQAATSASNPKSYAALFGSNAERTIRILHASVSGSSDEGRATVSFMEEFKGVEDNPKSKWTAKLNYTYTDVEMTTEKDPETGREVLKTTEPKFQVTHYEVAQQE